MHEEHSTLKVIGPVIGAVLLYVVVSAGIQQFRQDLTEVGSVMALADTANHAEVGDVEENQADVGSETDESVSADSADGEETTADNESSAESSDSSLADSGAEISTDESATEPEATGNDVPEPEATGNDVPETESTDEDSVALDDAGNGTATDATNDEADGLSDDESTPAAIVLDEADVATAFTKGACAGCHVIPGVRGASGAIGPDLTSIGVDAATRIEGYSAQEYIYESLMNPDAYVVAECPTGACPENVMLTAFTDGLSDDEVDMIVGYLLTLDGNE